jgi:hypothetical protein
VEVAEHVIPTEPFAAELERKRIVAVVPALETKTIANTIY